MYHKTLLLTTILILSAHLSLSASIPSSFLDLNDVETFLDVEICEGTSYNFGGQELTMTGIYVDVLPASDGCDSIITLTLTVQPILYQNLSVSICEGDSYSFGGDDLTMSGIYEEVFVSSMGCDSIVELDLTVLPTLMTDIYEEICTGEQIVFDFMVLQVSGTYSATFVSSSGCDSIVYLHLTVLEEFTTITLEDEIEAGIYSASEEITASGTISAGLNVQLVSTKVIRLTEGFHSMPGSTLLARIGESCQDEAMEIDPAPFPIISSVIKHLDVQVFPNPFQEGLTISYELARSTPVSVSLFDFSGRYLQSILPLQLETAGVHQLTWNSQKLSAGSYLLLVRAGEEIHTVKLVKSE